MPRLRRWIFRDVTDLLLVKRAEKDGLWRVVLADRMAARVAKSRFFAALRMTATTGKGEDRSKPRRNLVRHFFWNLSAQSPGDRSTRVYTATEFETKAVIIQT
jgi:hypothetical protein